MRRSLFNFVLVALICTPGTLRTQTVIETDIHDFVVDVGQRPFTSLVQASDGNFYGTMEDALGVGAFGVVYRLTPSGDYGFVHIFTGGMDGGQPQASLIEGPDGALYGTTSYGGGDYQSGTVFRLTLDGQLTTLFQFTGIENAVYPTTSLTLGSDGELYSVANMGGFDFSGAAFRLTTDGKYTQLFNFLSSNVDDFPWGQYPESPLLEYLPGQFTGTTYQGGKCEYPGCGTVFTIFSNGEFQQIYEFPSASYSPLQPSGFLTVADGALYGTAVSGPTYTNSGGALYKISPSGAYSTTHIFDPWPEGTWPVGVMLGSDGRLYVTNASGGTNSTGTLVAATTSGAVTVLHNFAALTVNGSDDGAQPESQLMQASDGSFYGTAPLGGRGSMGAVYRLAFDPPLPPPVQLNLSSASVNVGDEVKLSWALVNAASTTMQQCYAFVQDNLSGAGNWTGRQNGTASGNSYQGSTTIIPAATGTFTYALTCGGVESGFATLKVSGSGTKASSADLEVSVNPVAYGADTEISVTVSGQKGTPTGEVVLTANGTNVATLHLNGGSATAVFNSKAYPAGTYRVVAKYEGDSTFAQSSSPAVSVTLLPALAKTVAIVDDLSYEEIPLGANAPLTGEVYSIMKNSTPTGNVDFYIGGKLVTSAPLIDGYLNVQGSTAGFAAGTYSYYCKYEGDANDAPATSETKVVYIGVQNNQVFLDVNPVTVTPPGGVQLTARIINQNYDSYPTSGTVIFYAGTLEIGSAPVNSSGVATLTASTKGIASGAYLVTAVFQGNSSFGRSSSYPQTVTVK